RLGGGRRLPRRARRAGPDAWSDGPLRRRRPPRRRRAPPLPRPPPRARARPGRTGRVPVRASRNDHRRLGKPPAGRRRPQTAPHRALRSHLRRPETHMRKTATTTAAALAVVLPGTQAWAATRGTTTSAATKKKVTTAT